MNLYINKLFENVGSIVFEEVEEEERYKFLITGVTSCLGERLEFNQVSENCQPFKMSSHLEITLLCICAVEMTYQRLKIVCQTYDFVTENSEYGISFSFKPLVLKTGNAIFRIFMCLFKIHILPGY